MKRAISVLLSLTLILALATSCGQSSGGTQDPGTGAPASGAPAPETPAQTAPPADDGQVYELEVNLSKTEQSAKAYVEALQSMEEASGGRLKFHIYYSSSLLAANERPKGVAQGLADISDLIPVDFPGMFPITGELLSLPFMGYTDGSDGIYYQLMEEFPEIAAEWDNAGLKMLVMNQTRPVNGLFKTEQEIRVPADINGSKVIALDTVLATLVQGGGGAPVSMPFPEWYSSIEKNVANGILNNLAACNGAGLLEECRQFVEFGEGSGITCNLTGLVMNPDTWNSLPADLQALFDETMEELRTSYSAELKGQEDKAREIMDEAGYVHTILTADEVAQWAALVSDLTEETISRLDGQGLPAQAICDRVGELVQEAGG